MDENRQDKTESVLPATENKLWLPPLSPKDQEKLDHLQKNQMEEIIKRLRGRGYKVIEEYNDTGQPSKISREFPPRKTWWDWLQLLIVPLMLALVSISFSIFLSIGQNVNNQQLHDRDHIFALENRQNDMQIALDQQREATLKTYLDDMSDLLLNHKLRINPTDEVRQVARERTLTALRRLDASRNRIVVQFLRDASLIGVKNAVVDLSNGDLSHDDLREVNLSEVNLSGAGLYGTDLSNADLTGANLSNADLYGFDPSNADLNNADLSGAQLDGADLRYARVTGKQLAQARSLKGATMPDGSTHP